MALGVLIPGMTTNSQDVGGTQYGSAAMAIHGSRLFEQALLYDGMESTTTALAVVAASLRYRSTMPPCARSVSRPAAYPRRASSAVFAET